MAQHVDLHPVVVENLAYPKRVFRQYGDNLLQRDDLDVLFNAGVLPARKMTLI
jgi:hypothetical protein